MWFFKVLINLEKMKWEEIENYTSLPVSESWFAFLWFSSVKGLRAHPSYWQPTPIIFRYIQSDESHPNILWNAFKFDLVEPDRLSQLSHLTPSLVKIKGMQIKLHLQVSLLNFLTLRQKRTAPCGCFCIQDCNFASATKNKPFEIHCSCMFGHFFSILGQSDRV